MADQGKQNGADPSQETSPEPCGDAGVPPSAPRWKKPSEHFNRFDVKALAIAVRLHRAGDLHQAAEAYNEILKVHPDEPDVLHLLGLVFAEAGQSERATELIRRAIHFSPEQEAFHNSLGTIHRDTGSIDQAIRSFKRAVKINPSADEAIENLGDCLDRAGRRDDAIALFQKRCAGREPPLTISTRLAHWLETTANTTTETAVQKENPPEATT